MKLADFKLAAADFGTFGQGLSRPECVWIDADGIWASDARGGVARVVADGEPELLGSGIAEPNGYSRRPDGSFVVAGLADGGLHRIARTGPPASCSTRWTAARWAPSTAPGPTVPTASGCR